MNINNQNLQNKKKSGIWLNYIEFQTDVDISKKAHSHKQNLIE
jgi:hypothetical protein